jgi:hypothetical protein
MKKITVSFLLLLNVIFATAQKFTTGLIIDKEAYRKLPRQSLYGDGGKSEDKALNGIYKADLKPFCPKVGHQGSIGSCVGWSSGYAALTIAEAIQENKAYKQEDISKKANSALFVYNQIKIGDCSQGARIEDAMEFLQKKGNIPAKDFDLVIENCDRKPSEKDLENAQKHRIQDFVTLFGEEDADLIKINKIKLSLVQRKPVVVAMELAENFQQVKKGDLFWFPEIGNTNSLGAHAMCVIGFDDGKNAFEIMNSWGDYWGEDGFVWVKYDDFVKRCYHAYQFTLPKGAKPIHDNSTEIAKEYKGEFAFRYPQTIFNGKVDFAYENVTFNGRYYQLNKQDWGVGERFQLVSTKVEAGMYLYVFSYDPEGKINLHFPRDERLDAKFSGTIESAIITTPEVELIIPSPTKVLQFDKTGKEYVVVLYSNKPILNLNEKLNTLKSDNKKGDFTAKLYRAFDDGIVPIRKVEYLPNSMSCRTDSKEGYIIPLILELQIKK